MRSLKLAVRHCPGLGHVASTVPPSSRHTTEHPVQYAYLSSHLAPSTPRPTTPNSPYRIMSLEEITVDQASGSDGTLGRGETKARKGEPYARAQAGWGGGRELQASGGEGRTVDACDGACPSEGRWSQEGQQRGSSEMRVSIMELMR